MSVILFSCSSDIFTEMAQSYEQLKQFTSRSGHRTFSQDDDYQFYRALRRLYFANVACFLCQYHDETPLPEKDLTNIETFSDFKKIDYDPYKTTHQLVKQFFDAWSLLNYNLCTNDGELYKAMKSYEYIDGLARCYADAFIDSLS